MPERSAPTPVYFTSLEIENLRCFGDRQRLDLTGEDGRPARWTLILGDNGVGKTTLLQCLGWMRPVPAGVDPALLAEENEVLEGLLRNGPGLKIVLRARLSAGAKLSADDPKVTSASKKSDAMKTGVELLFDTNRLLAEHKNLSSPPKAKQLASGGLDEPLIVAYGANRQRGAHNLAKGDLARLRLKPTRGSWHRLLSWQTSTISFVAT